MPSSSDSPLQRRLLVIQLAGAGLGASSAVALAQGRKSPAPEEPSGGKAPRREAPRPSGETDADPGDMPGNGRGEAGGGRRLGPTDADPSDEVGRGRGGAGASDADPGDPPGRGRGGERQAGPTDADPSDEAGRGRGGMAASDADPGDPPGRGRGAAPPEIRTQRPAKKT